MGKRYIEIFEERFDRGNSNLYYEAFDKKMHKVGGSDISSLNIKIDEIKENIEMVLNSIKAASFEEGVVPKLSWVDEVYSVTNTLTKCSTNNPVARISKGKPYSALLTADEDYSFATVSGTMGGTELPTTGVNSFVKDSTTVEGAKEVFIPNVTGNLVIVATAESNG